MGLLPIALGIKELLQEFYKKGKEGNGDDSDDIEIKPHFQKAGGCPSFLEIAMVTIANGGDNIGIYTPVCSKQ